MMTTMNLQSLFQDVESKRNEVSLRNSAALLYEKGRGGSRCKRVCFGARTFSVCKRVCFGARTFSVCKRVCFGARTFSCHTHSLSWCKCWFSYFFCLRIFCKPASSKKIKEGQTCLQKNAMRKMKQKRFLSSCGSLQGKETHGISHWNPHSPPSTQARIHV